MSASAYPNRTRFLLALALLFTGCAPAIPAVKLESTTPMANVAAKVTPCRVTGEEKERRLYEGTATASLERWHTGIGSIVIRHPKGLVVIDPAFGRTIAEDLRRSPPWFGAVMGTGSGKEPLIGGLDRAGIDPRDVQYVLLSHAHWDHAGALRDLPRSRVLMDAKEYQFARSRRGFVDHGAMRHHFDIAPMRFAPFIFDGPPYENFPASHDVFGDGSIVAVPTRGHTPGHTAYFINTPTGRLLYVGDAAWTLEGIKQPVHKNPLASAIADYDLEGVAQTLGKLHAIYEQRKDIQIIPAHDWDAMSVVPECAPSP